MEARRLRAGTREGLAVASRIEVVRELCWRLNALPPSDMNARKALLSEIMGRPLPDTLNIHPPFYSDYGLNIALGDRVFISQCCTFYDLGGITIGDRVMIGTNSTLVTAGHPIELAARYEFVTMAPIVIEADVWIGAAATIAPGVTIGHGSVVGAGAVVAKDVPPMTVVTSSSVVERKRLADTSENDATSARG